MKHGLRIDYKSLRKINPETARLAVLEYLKTNKHNIAQASRVFGINRSVVYDILNKEKEGNLKDRSKAPKYQPNKTSNKTENKVIEIKNKTHLGPKRLSRYLNKYENILVPSGTIRHILRRNKDRLTYKVKGRQRRKEKRELLIGTLLSHLRLFKWTLNLSEIKKALTKKQIIHLDHFDIPNYQWGALDVKF